MNEARMNLDWDGMAAAAHKGIDRDQFARRQRARMRKEQRTARRRRTVDQAVDEPDRPCGT